MTLSEQVAALEAELKIANESSAAWRKLANQEEQRAIAAESQLAAAQKQTRIEITARDHYRDERDAAIAEAVAAELFIELIGNHIERRRDARARQYWSN